MPDNITSLMTSTNEVTVFENDQFGSIRTIIRNGEPWFAAVDVCRALDIQNTANALSRLDEDEKGVDSIYTPGGVQELLMVNEPGLYALVLGSRKPEARASHEVSTGAETSHQQLSVAGAFTIECERCSQKPQHL